MVKQKKHTLLLENDYNYDLIGICTHFQDYRLVWGLNNQFKFNLSKAKDNFSLIRKQNQEVHFPYYYSINEEKHLEIYLIKNKHEGNYLINEKQQIDYFLFLCNNFVFQIDECLNQMRQIQSIMAAYNFEPTTIPSTEYILF
jgi:hypothetical protein